MPSPPCLCASVVKPSCPPPLRAGGELGAVEGQAQAVGGAVELVQVVGRQEEVGRAQVLVHLRLVVGPADGDRDLRAERGTT